MVVTAKPMTLPAEAGLSDGTWSASAEESASQPAAAAPRPTRRSIIARCPFDPVMRPPLSLSAADRGAEAHSAPLQRRRIPDSGARGNTLVYRLERPDSIILSQQSAANP